MKPWMFPVAIMALQVGADLVYCANAKLSLGVFYITCAASNAALTFIR